MSNSSTPLTLPDLIRIDRHVLIVGRGAGVDVRLPHPAVSRRHAELRRDGDAILVRDLSFSPGGLLVNGTAVSDARLGQDDVVFFGPIAFEVKAGLMRRLTETGGVTVEARGLTVLRRRRVA